ncbi:MAG: aldo/keto reductase [Bacteroidales bacterium]
MYINRRQFLEMTATAAALISLGGAFTSCKKDGDPPYGISRRSLGKTGLNVSLLSVGGWNIGRDILSDNESIAIMRTAIDEGINFFDNAWSYHDGRSEELMGKALQDGYRQRVILMTKHLSREPEKAKQHLEDSLRRLQTDVIDVWQIHELMTLDEVDQVYTSGLLDYLENVKKSGKIRFIGFTGHANPEVHMEMINRGFNWDTVQMPVNILDYHYLSFSKNVLPLAIEKNIGIIAMKTLAGTPGVLFQNGIASVSECLRFALTLPVSTVSSGMDSMEILRENIETARNFTPMTQVEIENLVALSLEPSKDGKYESYKSVEI